MGFETSIEFERLLDYFYKKTGIFFSEKRSIVAGRVEDFFRENGYFDRSQFVELLENDKNLEQKIINLLTVNETYFFRESRGIDIFVSLAKKLDRNFRVLCIPCSTGEEPYSLAIALNEAGVDSSKYEIIGIDINSKVIEEAERGVYRTRSIHRTDDLIKEKYFDHNGEFVSVKPHIKKGVTFQVCNLFDSCMSTLGKFDFVFSRNLLIYFDQASRLRAEKVLYNTLKEGGFLFVGHADLIKNEVGYKRHFDQGVLYYEG